MTSRPTRRRGLVSWFASWLLRPSTMQLAVMVLRLVDLIARIIDRLS